MEWGSALVLICRTALNSNCGIVLEQLQSTLVLTRSDGHRPKPHLTVQWLSNIMKAGFQRLILAGNTDGSSVTVTYTASTFTTHRISARAGYLPS